MSLFFEVVKIHPNAVIPTKADGNLGFDLHCVEDDSFYGCPRKKGLCPRQQHLFHTGITMAIPEGCGVILKDSSATMWRSNPKFPSILVGMTAFG